MCGLLASATINTPPISNEVFKKLLATMSHRGPDGNGVERYFDDALNFQVYLGHNRLSIIDLTEFARQPMSDITGRYKIIFNGEIYNYREIRGALEAEGVSFRTNSDTEVLLYAWITWGARGLTQLIGMFSFLVYDLFENKIHCVRDAFGIKPFHIFVNRNEFYCASEVTPILLAIRGRATLNYQSVYNYLVNDDYDRPSQSIFNEIESVLPGFVVTIAVENGEFKKTIAQWAKLGEIEDSDLTYESAVLRARELLVCSVKYHMRSDVEIGAALSGGVDSSAIVCLMKSINPNTRFHTFSYVPDSRDFNEESWIDMVNNHIDAIPHKVRFAPEELFNGLVDLIKFQGLPFGSTSIYAQYKVFEEAKKSGIKVVLEGQGADEIFAGYDGYLGERFASLLEQRRYSDAVKFVRAWTRGTRRSFIDALVLIIKQFTPPYFYTFGLRVFGRSNAPKWLNVEEFIIRSTSLTAWKLGLSPHFRGQRVKEKLLSQIISKHLPSLLRHGDRNSMANSVENRVPFLTLPIADFVLSLPEDFLVSKDGVTKGLLRDAMRGIVPDEVLDRKDKIGFGTLTLSDSAYLWKNFKNDFLLAAPKNIFNVDSLEKYLDFATKGKNELDWQPWRILNFIIWYKVVFEGGVFDLKSPQMAQFS
jgi:asparagine synthase (glutamine-hydrolysing)